jgi:Protein of unknown function (DUF2726)
LALSGFPSLPWLLAGAFFTAFGALLGWVVFTRFWAPRRPLPQRWDLTPRPVFSHYERRLFKHLRQALPHHVVLAKVPLVRLCQPSDPGRVRFWFELLGSAHVGFLVCSPAGRVLAALDLDDGRPTAARAQQIKERVLRACHLPYLRCLPGHWPSHSELQRMVPAAPAPDETARPMRRQSDAPQASAMPAPNSRSWAPTMADGKRSAHGEHGAPGARWKHSDHGPDALFDTHALPVVHEVASGYGPLTEPATAFRPTGHMNPMNAPGAAAPQPRSGTPARPAPLRH